MSTAALELLITLKDEASDRLSSITGSLSGVGNAALAVAGGGLVALGAGLTSAVNAAGEFEAGMNNFASVAGGALAQAGFSLDDVKAKALELGAVTQFSAAQAQDAMINLAKGGVPVADIMGQATDATLALAAAGSLELGPAADIVSKQLGVWGETGVTAAQVADQLAQAANASTVDVDELALGLANVGGVAKASGVSFDDLTQTMALIAPGFSSAADAGTSLKTMILALQPSTVGAKSAMQDLGLTYFDTAKAAQTFGVDISKSKDPMEEVDAAMRQWIETHKGLKQGTEEFNKAFSEMYAGFNSSKFYDTSGAFIGMESSAALLQDALGGLSEAEQSAALKAVFGTDAFRAASIVVNQGAAGFTAMGDAMTTAGTAADQSAIKQQGFAFALDSMKGTIETLQIVIGSALLPVLTSLIGTMTGGINGVLAFAQGILSANDPLAALVTAVTAAVPGFAGVVAAAQQVWPVLQQVATAAQPLIDMLGANLVPILGAVATVLGGAVLIALGGIVAGFVAAVAPIAALVAGLSLLYAAFTSNFMGIQTIVTSVLGAVLSIVMSVGSQIVSFWTANGASIMASAQAAWNGLQALVSSALAGVMAVVSAIGGQIAAFWSANGASILATVQATWAQLGAIIGGALQIAGAVISAFAGVVTTVFGGIVAFIQANSASIQAVLTGAWQVIQGVITAAMGVIQGVIRTVLAAIQGDWSGVWAGLSQIVSSAISGIGSVLAGLGNIVRGALGLLGGVIAEAAAAAGRAALGLGKSIVDGIMSGLSAAAGRLTKAVSDLAKGALDAAKSALGIKSPSKAFAQQVGAPSAEGIAAGFTAAMPKVTTNLVNGVAGLMEKVASAVENGSKALAAVSGFQGSSGSGLSGFLAAIKDMAIQFNDAAVELGGRILGTATRFADTIGKVTAPIDTALKALGGLVDFVAPARANISAFIASMYVLLNALNNMAAMFEAKAIKAAAVFAEGAGKMLGVVSPAIDALKKLPDLVVPAQSQVNAFGESLFLIVRELLNVAALFAEQSLKAGAAFGEAGAKLIAVVGPAIDALKKLPELVVPADGALAVFGDALTRTVQTLIQVASLFAQDAVDAAAKFAEGAGKAIGIVGTSVDSFTKLATFTGISQAAIDAFGAGLRMVLARLLSISSLFSREAIAAAGVFGEGAGKAISALGAGIDTLGKLVTFVAPAEANVSAFFRSLADLLEKMGSWSANFEVDMLEATAAFSAGVQKSVAGIGAAVDALGKLVDFTAPAEKHVSAFFLALADLLERMGSWAGSFEADMLASTATFAAGVSQSVAPLKGAIDSLSSFADFVPPAQKAVSAFFAALTVVLQQIQQVSALFGAEAVASAATFATNVATVVSQLKGALQAFGSLGDTSVKPAVLGAFMQAAQSLIAQMAAYLPPNAEVIGSNTIVGLINGIVGQRSNLIAAMTNTVLAAVQAAQATLGIASPSKVFEQLGQYTGQGMAGGMNAMQPAVASAGAGLGMAAVGGASGGVGSSRSGGAAGPINITFAAGAIAINGVQGGLNDKHLKTLAGYIKEDIGADMRGR